MLIAIVGGILVLGSVVAFALWQMVSADLIDVTMPATAGGQRIEKFDVTFVSFDGDTDMADLSVQTETGITYNSTLVKPQGNGQLLSVSAKPRQWVFAWQGSGPKFAMQGISGKQDGVGEDYILSHCTAGALTYHPGSQRYPTREYCYDHYLRTDTWISKQMFMVTSSRAEIYVAIVDHPVDDVTTQRARAFIDDAIKYPRTMHQARGVTALMRAVGSPKPAWIAWLKKHTTSTTQQLRNESEPPQDALVEEVLMGRAELASSEITATYAVLTEFEDTNTLASHMEPYNRTAGLACSFAVDHEFASDAATRKERIEAISQALNKPNFKDLMSPIWAEADLQIMLDDKATWEEHSEILPRWGHVWRWLSSRKPETLKRHIDLFWPYYQDIGTPQILRRWLTEIMFKLEPAKTFDITLELLEEHRADYAKVTIIGLLDVAGEIKRVTTNDRQLVDTWKTIIKERRDRLMKMLLEDCPKWQPHTKQSRKSNITYCVEAKAILQMLDMIGEKGASNKVYPLLKAASAPYSN